MLKRELSRIHGLFLKFWEGLERGVYIWAAQWEIHHKDIPLYCENWAGQAPGKKGRGRESRIIFLEGQGGTGGVYIFLERRMEIIFLEGQPCGI
jgi:hypothetical protein